MLIDVLLQCMTNIQRATTEVISVSLPKPTVKKLEKVRKLRGQSRSSYLAHLIEKEVERDRWERIFKKGREVARKLKITSEDDIDRILHEV